MTISYFQGLQDKVSQSGTVLDNPGCMAYMNLKGTQLLSG